MSVFVNVRRAGRALGASLALLTLMTACGGGTSQVQAFVPNRLIVFGDEHSLLVDDGLANARKYGINGLDASSVRDCLLLPNWVQSLAAYYNIVFAQCNKTAAVPKAFMWARLGARVDDPATGMAAQMAAQTTALGAVTSGDMVAVMMGANDVVDLGQQVQAGTLSHEQALGEARRRGSVLAQRINEILGAGARAIVSTVPDMGLSPLAIAMEAQSAGAAARLKSLTFEFNATLRTGIDPNRFDGRNFGLVLADDLVQAMARIPSAYNLNDVVNAACVTALPQCTSATTDLVSGATGANYLWADDRRLAPTAQTQIGTLAVERAANNPF